METDEKTAEWKPIQFVNKYNAVPEAATNRSAMLHSNQTVIIRKRTL